MGSAGAPTAFQAWSKSCEDTLALQGGLYQWALTQQSQRFQDRQVIDSEMFGLYKSQIDADFLLYKGNRDNYDSLKAMYHVKDGKKYIGEKYDMQKAHEVCNKFKDKLEEDIEVADVYVAINAQYHDYCELFEKWFGKGNFDEMVFESAIAFWLDDVDFGEDKLWKYFNELK